jgi:hypothetical protein
MKEKPEPTSVSTALSTSVSTSVSVSMSVFMSLSMSVSLSVSVHCHVNFYVKKPAHSTVHAECSCGPDTQNVHAARIYIMDMQHGHRTWA